MGRVSFCSQLPLSPGTPLSVLTPAWPLGCSGCRGVPSSSPNRSAGGRGPGGAWSPRRWASPPRASDRPEQPPSLLRKPLQPLPGVPVFMACAFCCRSLLGKASLGLGWVWLLWDASGSQRANATFATEGNRALVLSRTFADLAFLRGNAPKLSYPWILERCFQASDPTKMGLTGSLVRGPRWVSP